MIGNVASFVDLTPVGVVRHKQTDTHTHKANPPSSENSSAVWTLTKVKKIFSKKETSDQSSYGPKLQLYFFDIS